MREVDSVKIMTLFSTYTHGAPNILQNNRTSTIDKFRLFFGAMVCPENDIAVPNLAQLRTFGDHDRIADIGNTIITALIQNSTFRTLQELVLQDLQ